ncbi:MAG: primosomal replication protein [Colwellia sp.]|nr:primosomal replication protein [Colwellia sp.]
MQLPLDRITAVLDDLTEQAKIIDAENQQTKSHYLLKDKDIFSEALFATNSDRIQPYVDEIRGKTIELSRLLRNGKNELSQNRLQCIEQQISAILNAIRSNKGIHQEAQYRLTAINARRYKKAAKQLFKSSQALYQQLSEHHEFERRLLAMLNERDLLRKSATPSKAKKLSDEVLALHQRLGRCRQAISKIERQIEVADKPR